MNYNNLIKIIYDKDDLKFEKWVGHRSSIKNTIDKRVKEINLDNKSIAIWGAGKCYDIDLNYLSNRFDKVVLVDINKSSMEDALTMQNVNNRENIQIKKIDFMNNTDIIYKQFFKLIKNRKSIKELKKYLEDLKNSIIKNGELKSNLDKYDFVVCLAVHSQLLVGMDVILLEAEKFYDKKDIKDLVHIFKECQKEAAKRLNREIIEHSSNLLFVGFDLMELAIKDNTEKFYYEVQDALLKNDTAGVIKIAMQRPVSGAGHGAEDIWNYVMNGRLGIDAMDCWIWDYDMEKSYVFVLETLIKNTNV